MAETIKVGIIGAGWPGMAHARGYLAAGGFKIVAVADLIPQRRKQLMGEFNVAREYASAEDLLRDAEVAAVSVCLPNDQHAPVAAAALRAGKHVLCETPPGISVKDARRMQSAAQSNSKVLLYGFQRRFGGHEQAARLAIAKGFIGEPYHVRAVWTRTRAVPLGTGWFTQKEKSGGGAMADIGLHVLDLAWHLLGQPTPSSAFAVAYRRLPELVPQGTPYDVDDQAFALLRFDGNKSIELATSWAINQPPQQNGAVCRVYGSAGAVEVYTPQGAVVYRDFKPDGTCRENPLKPPKTTHHAALCRHFKDAIQGKASPMIGPNEGVALMRMLDAVHKSAEAGRSVTI